MDAGPKADLPSDVIGKRPPAWLFNPEDEAVGTCLRPDILLISCPGHDGTVPLPKEFPKQTHIIEIGYGSDINMSDKEVLKHQQHAQLAQLLEKPGLNNTVTTHTIILGHTGSTECDGRQREGKHSRRHRGPGQGGAQQRTDPANEDQASKPNTDTNTRPPPPPEATRLKRRDTTGSHPSCPPTPLEW